MERKLGDALVVQSFVGLEDADIERLEEMLGVRQQHENADAIVSTELDRC
jgi:hypothetical protein